MCNAHTKKLVYVVCVFFWKKYYLDWNTIFTDDIVYVF